MNEINSMTREFIDFDALVETEVDLLANQSVGFKIKIVKEQGQNFFTLDGDITVTEEGKKESFHFYDKIRRGQPKFFGFWDDAFEKEGVSINVAKRIHVNSIGKLKNKNIIEFLAAENGFFVLSNYNKLRVSRVV